MSDVDDTGYYRYHRHHRRHHRLLISQDHGTGGSYASTPDSDSDIARALIAIVAIGLLLAWLVSGTNGRLDRMNELSDQNSAGRYLR